MNTLSWKERKALQRYKVKGVLVWNTARKGAYERGMKLTNSRMPAKY